MSDPAARRGRLRSRWRKLRRDPAAFADDLPVAPLRAMALRALLGWTLAQRREGLARAWRRDGVGLRRGDGLYELRSGHGGTPRRWPQWLEVRPEEGGFVLAAFDAHGGFLAACEARPEAPGMLAIGGRPATVRAYRIDGAGDLPEKLSVQPAARGDLLRRARSEGSGLAEALRQAWPPAERRPAEPSRAAYRAWIGRNELSAADRKAIRAAISDLPARPVISVLMPVHDPRPAYLAAALASLDAQFYPHWQLCVVDDGSASPKIRALLAERGGDPRVRQRRHDQALGVAAATNAALELASGEICLFLDHDDLLAPHALALIASAFVRHPALQAVYSDEDTIDAEGRRSAPLFKPDFDSERLLAQNYVNHAFAVRTGLLRRLGGLREGLDGAQDHDLVLRVAEAVPTGGIGHVPAVLYHWRVYPGGATLSQRQKGAAKARLAVVRDALDRRGEPAQLRIGPGGYVAVDRELAQPLPRVLAIVPTRDRPGLLRSCVLGLLEQTVWPSLKVRIVDNGSRSKEGLRVLDELAADPRVEVLRIDAPFNFSALNNAAAKGAEAELLAFVNDDILVVEPGWLARMAALAMRPEAGAVGAKLYYPDGRLQHAGLILGLGPQGVAGHEFRGQAADTPGPQRRLFVTHEVSAVTAACMVVERRKFEAVGGFDERFAVAFNDVDLCLRLRAEGWRNLWTPFARLIHVESATRGADTNPARAARFKGEVERMQARWGGALTHDPYYNLNLTLEDEGFGLARTSRLELKRLLGG